MVITPDLMSVLIGEPRRVRLVDPAGRMISDATWSVSDPGVLELQADAEPIITGRTPGTVTITAFWKAELAEAKVTVFAGTRLPYGTVFWSVKPLPGHSADKMGVAQPAGGPDVFTTEHDSHGHSVVRALTSDGRELWRSLVDFSQPSSESSAPSSGRPRSQQGLPTRTRPADRGGTSARQPPAGEPQK